MSLSPEGKTDIVIGNISGQRSIYFDTNKYMLDNELAEDMANRVAADSELSVSLDACALKHGEIVLRITNASDETIANAVEYTVECIMGSRR